MQKLKMAGLGLAAERAIETQIELIADQIHTGEAIIADLAHLELIIRNLDSSLPRSAKELAAEDDEYANSMGAHDEDESRAAMKKALFVQLPAKLMGLDENSDEQQVFPL